ncbi:MAG TPA: hypothetical protein VGS58_17595, partial [Candidatus Sulfopaludibacter sp.]|nr:hypothetical protein [Candidatus Sulfopaludibacter sp.]
TLTTEADRVRSLVDQINAGGQDETSAIDQIIRAAATMNEVTGATAASAEESAQAAELLKGQAETLLQVVQGLEELVGAVAV